MREQRIAALKAELASRRGLKSESEPHESDAFGAFGRGIAKGVGAVPDLLALPANIALGLQGKEPLSSNDLLNLPTNIARLLQGKESLTPSEMGLSTPSFSELAGQGYDALIGNGQKPQNLGERAAESAGEFISGGGLLGKAGKAGGAIKNFLATKGVKGYGALGTAGIGSELAREAAPENPVAPLLGAIAGGFAPSLAPNILKGGLGAAKTIANAPSKLKETVLPSAKIKRESAQLDKILKDISPGYEGEVNVDIRKASKEITSKEKKALKEKAKPHYEKASPVRVEREKLQEILHNNPVVDTAFKKVLKEDAYQKDIRKYGVNSVHTLDLVKKELDKNIRNLMKVHSSEENAFKAKKIGESRDELVTELDRISPEYQKGRNIYSEDLPAIKALQETKIGRFSKLNDEQLKNIGKNIFDKTETNPKRFEKVRDLLYKENPEAWDAITKQEIKRKIGSTEKGAKHFYDTVLKDEQQYKQLESALIHNPKAQAQLADLRDFYANMGKWGKTGEIFKGLLPENWQKSILGRTSDLIFEPRWSGDLKKLANADKESFLKLTKDFVKKIGTRSALGATHGVKEREQNEEPAKEAPNQDRIKQLKEELERRRTKSTSQTDESGLEPELLKKIEHAESGGNPHAKAKTSSASGVLQFTNGTWKEGIKKYGEEEGVHLRDKNKPEAQRKIARRMLSDNSKELEKHLGRKPKPGEIYATHFLGLGGAKKLLKSNKREIASHIFPKEAQANRAIFYERGRPITVAELTHKLNSKIT